MFFSLVFIGEYCDNPPGVNALRKPPELPNAQNGESYDSVRNPGAGHHIVYANKNTYPGYLITFT